MPVVPFETLPDAARVWVFGSDKPLSEDGTNTLLEGVDAHLENWKAHGAPLTVSRTWRDGRFLVVAVDQSTAGASGCSIDGLFRVLQQLEREVGANLVGGGRVFYRDRTGVVQSTSRAEIGSLISERNIGRGAWRIVVIARLARLGGQRRTKQRQAGRDQQKSFWMHSLDRPFGRPRREVELVHAEANMTAG